MARSVPVKPENGHLELAADRLRAGVVGACGELGDPKEVLRCQLPYEGNALPHQGLYAGMGQFWLDSPPALRYKSSRLVNLGKPV